MDVLPDENGAGLGSRQGEMGPSPALSAWGDGVPPGKVPGDE